MLKEYFTDGLIQIAIILSLLRIDLHPQSNLIAYPEIQELLQGPTSAYTQTRFHRHNWNHRIGAFVHPKNIDNEIGELIHDLHSLGRYGNNNGLNTRIDAYLVSDPTPPSLASDANNNQNDVNNGTHNETAQAEGTNTGQREEENRIRKEEMPPFGAELTREDMDLIDILWRQDMDLGVGREVFDTNLRREQEKTRELELQKQQQKEALEKQAQQQQQQQETQLNNNNNVTFTVDGETGELIPVPNSAPAAAGSSNNGSSTSQTQPAAPLHNSTADLDMDEALQFISEEFRNQQQQQPQQQQPPQQPQQQFVRQDSFEQRWQDFTTFLNNQNGTNDNIALNNTTAPQNALLNNATLPAPQPNNTDFNMNPPPQPITVAPNDTSYIPFNATLPGGFNPINQTLMGGLDNLLPPGGGGGGSANPSMAFPFNATTDSFLQDLLDEEDLDNLDFNAMDLNNLEGLVQGGGGGEEKEEKMDDASSDSAVSSMEGSPRDFDSMSNVSHYHGIEGGATGGRDDLYTSSSVVMKKEHHDPSFNMSDFGFSEEPAHMLNTSTNSTEEEELYNPSADPRHVAHNHTYPLAPGQQRRERKLTPEEKRASAQMSRDEKKAKAMKIPLTVDDIIHSPVDEFNDMLTRCRLSDAQLQLVRDIRRRGKNKVAAQNCRKRKMEVIQSLDDEVAGIRNERDRLAREKNRLQKQHGDMKHKYKQLYQEVFRSLRDDQGRPYDPEQFTLQQTSDGNVFLVPINSTLPQTDHEEKRTHKRKGKKSN